MHTSLLHLLHMSTTSYRLPGGEMLSRVEISDSSMSWDKKNLVNRAVDAELCWILLKLQNDAMHRYSQRDQFLSYQLLCLAPRVG
jgi:hypothetical protein